MCLGVLLDTSVIYLHGFIVLFTIKLNEWKFSKFAVV